MSPAAPSCSSPTSASIPFPQQPKSARPRNATCRSASSLSLIICTILYVGGCHCPAGHDEVHDFRFRRSRRSAVAYALKYLGAHPFFRSVIVVGAITGMISSLLVFQYGQARIWYAMSRDGLLPKLFRPRAPQVQDSLLVHLDCLLCRGNSGRPGGHRRCRRSFQYWHAVRVRPGVAGRYFSAPPAARSPPRFPRPLCSMVSADLACCSVCWTDDGTHRDHVAAFLHLAGAWASDLQSSTAAITASLPKPKARRTDDLRFADRSFAPSELTPLRFLPRACALGYILCAASRLGHGFEATDSKSESHLRSAI